MRRGLMVKKFSNKGQYSDAVCVNSWVFNRGEILVWKPQGGPRRTENALKSGREANYVLLSHDNWTRETETES